MKDITSSAASHDMQPHLPLESAEMLWGTALPVSSPASMAALELIQDLEAAVRQIDPLLVSLSTLHKLSSTTPFLHTLLGEKPLTDYLATDSTVATSDDVARLLSVVGELSTDITSEIVMRPAPQGVYSVTGVRQNAPPSMRVLYTYSLCNVSRVIKEYTSVALPLSDREPFEAHVLTGLAAGDHLWRVTRRNSQVLGVLFGYGMKGSSSFAEHEVLREEVYSSTGKSQYMKRDRLASLQTELQRLPDNHALYRDGVFSPKPFSVRFVSGTSNEVDGLVRGYGINDMFFDRAIQNPLCPLICLSVITGRLTRSDAQALLAAHTPSHPDSLSP